MPQPGLSGCRCRRVGPVRPPLRVSAFSFICRTRIRWLGTGQRPLPNAPLIQPRPDRTKILLAKLQSTHRFRKSIFTVPPGAVRRAVPVPRRAGPGHFTAFPEPREGVLHSLFATAAYKFPIAAGIRSQDYSTNMVPVRTSGWLQARTGTPNHPGRVAKYLG